MSEQTNPAQEVFLKDVANHKMTILMENGVYRHLRFKHPENYFSWFDIVTFPGHLCYVGDMGSFVFARLEDMFQFFRTDFEDGTPRINRSYWGEKLQAVDRDGRKGSHRQFSGDKVKDHIEEIVKEWVEEWKIPYETSDEGSAAARDAFEKLLREEIEDQINLDEGEEVAYHDLRDFSFTYGAKRYEFQDTWEWDCEDYTYRFTWCCYAIAWAIQQYDKEKSAALVVAG
jgi:hypothetical protein